MSVADTIGTSPSSILFNDVIVPLSILNMMKYKYSYGRKLSQDRLAEEIIKLPVKNDIPDWAFMENYIKQMPYGDII